MESQAAVGRRECSRQRGGTCKGPEAGRKPGELTVMRQGERLLKLRGKRNSFTFCWKSK